MILDGKSTADTVLKKVKTKVDKMKRKPHLAVILAGNDPASVIYVKNKKKTAENIGIKSTVIELPYNVKEEVILDYIHKLNTDSDITGILVQMPLPPHINRNNIVYAIAPEKDVDCFCPENVGLLAIGAVPHYYPVTPQGILVLLDHYNIELEGKHAVVIGRSNIVGKPMAQMLLRRNATVTVCHTFTHNLGDIIKAADIIVSAAGKKIVRCKMVKYKSIFVDVGISRNTNGKLTGDLNWELDFKNFSDVVSYFEYISPVPGGVGPMTVASLMLNVSGC